MTTPAKPIIELLFPHLSVIEQPLAGETAAPRSVLASPSPIRLIAFNSRSA